jgi:hypothetical protein
MSQRGFLGTAVAAGSGTAITVVAGANPAMARASLTGQQHAMILDMAKAGSVFPLRL